jgi:cellulose synthase/poly-beta-1,6-N-acetylglucosamine synthase-like glycosyltransferase
MANAAVSRKALRAIGNRFWGEVASEDIDLSLRISKSGFKLFYQPNAVVKLIHGFSISQFCRQLWSAGLSHPLAIKTHAERVLEIRFQYFGGVSISIPFPWQAMIYWGDFHFMHFLGFLALFQTVSMTAQGNSPGFILGTTPLLLLWVMFAFFIFKYFLPVLKIQPSSEFFLWCWIRYCSNLTMFLGGLEGSFRFKRFYIEQSL